MICCEQHLVARVDGQVCWQASVWSKGWPLAAMRHQCRASVYVYVTIPAAFFFTNEDQHECSKYGQVQHKGHTR